MNEQAEARKLMVVDDSQIVLEGYRQYLDATGVAAVFYDDPQQALEAFIQHHATLSAVLTDFNMPGMSGVQLAEAIRNLAPTIKTAGTIPIVIISNEYPSERITPAVEAEVIDRAFQKPIQVKELDQLIADIPNMTTAKLQKLGI